MNHMALHPDKTKFMLITTRQTRQNIVSYLHPLIVKGNIIEEVQNHSVLGEKEMITIHLGHSSEYSV